jgi:V/A-type H+-transporting ATPase subunit I
MAFFYSIFLGFIMADIGYGLIMLIGGGALYFKIKRDSSVKRLAGVFAVGGILAIIWGFLFNSLFGIELAFMPTVMPNAQKDMWSLAGIKVPSVLVISLLIGNVQLFAGYVCRAVQCIRRGEVVDGLCDGVTWAVFSVGVALAIIGFLEEAGMSILATVGGIMAGVGLVAAMLTAGRKEKIVGKFTKGFGAAYGVINYASDILSYARLYGLMLSGAVIAQIVSQYGVQFIVSGNVALIILGIVLMVVGHAFNLAMSLLGAYIHDARLQYVEFYGRFYEGEGELFAPLGSSHKYIYLKS